MEQEPVVDDDMVDETDTDVARDDRKQERERDENSRPGIKKGARRHLIKSQVMITALALLTALLSLEQRYDFRFEWELKKEAHSIPCVRALSRPQCPQQTVM